MLRTILVILIVTVLVDAFIYDGHYTQSVYRGLTVAADEFVAFIGDVVDYAPKSNASP